MDKKDYDESLKILQKEYQAKCLALDIEYAGANNPYKIGDIIEDHISIISIEKVHYRSSGLNGVPACFYTGPELKKDLMPKKKSKIGTIFQENVIRKINPKT